MSTDNNQMTDSLEVELNPVPELDRPADSATRDEWVAYAVGLGANEDHLEGDSAHWSDDDGDYIDAEKFTKSDLIDLCDRLGG